MGNLDGLVSALIFLGFVICLATWGAWELIDWAFIDDAIKTTSPIVPEIELIIEDNKVDTLYVYRKP
jgi:hypothetical protein